LQKQLKRVFLAFILLQPFLDVYFFYVPPLSTLFSFSISTIIRLILILVVAVMFVISERFSRRDWLIFTYIGALAIYFVLHVWNASHFISVNPNNFHFSLVGEAFYVLRMLVPLFTLFVTNRLDFTESTITKVIQILVGLISGSIVITNLFGFALASYGGGWITGSIFTWFSSAVGGSYYGLASKGFFYFANAISAVEILLTPLILYVVFKRLNWLNGILAFSQLLAMFMLGTKTSTYGFIGMAGLFVIAYLTHTLLLKNVKFEWSHLAIIAALLVVATALVPISPNSNRANFDVSVQTTRKETEKQAKIKTLEKRLDAQLVGKTAAERKPILVKYIKKNWSRYSLNKKFVFESYSYKNDPEFWFGVMRWPIAERLNYRQVEQAMLDHVKAYNHNPLDAWFGITYTRMNNIFNLEQDFVSQWYSMGYLGVLLLLMPYVFVGVYGVYAWLRYAAVRQFYVSALLLGVVAMVGASVYSGNVMDFLTDTILLGFFEGVMIAAIRRAKQGRLSA